MYGCQQFFSLSSFFFFFVLTYSQAQQTSKRREENASQARINGVVEIVFIHARDREIERKNNVVCLDVYTHAYFLFSHVRRRRRCLLLLLLLLPSLDVQYRLYSKQDINFDCADRRKERRGRIEFSFDAIASHQHIKTRRETTLI